ncbi:hypothetical protein GPECTOR_47g311 [Gonium pectorale]|uniref:Uncharacterized protein n=1 Tax=Gonium pectorale TaxID=33097 RepID=A0A150G845_GONPE|nr:hypothetical protein GPECTOR_47g311 [Gonium pectorale]|eukprot:KXZ46036.1 hypothetical protein GPECTOR_47g311 [Gonium pectorale]
MEEPAPGNGAAVDAAASAADSSAGMAALLAVADPPLIPAAGPLGPRAVALPGLSLSSPAAEPPELAPAVATVAALEEPVAVAAEPVAAEGGHAMVAQEEPAAAVAAVQSVPLEPPGAAAVVASGVLVPAEADGAAAGPAADTEAAAELRDDPKGPAAGAESVTPRVKLELRVDDGGLVAVSVVTLDGGEVSGGASQAGLTAPASDSATVARPQVPAAPAAAAVAAAFPFDRELAAEAAAAGAATGAEAAAEALAPQAALAVAESATSSVTESSQEQTAAAASQTSDAPSATSAPVRLRLSVTGGGLVSVSIVGLAEGSAAVEGSPASAGSERKPAATTAAPALAPEQTSRAGSGADDGARVELRIKVTGGESVSVSIVAATEEGSGSPGTYTREAVLAPAEVEVEVSAAQSGTTGNEGRLDAAAEQVAPLLAGPAAPGPGTGAVLDGQAEGTQPVSEYGVGELSDESAAPPACHTHAGPPDGPAASPAAPPELQSEAAPANDSGAVAVIGSSANGTGADVVDSGAGAGAAVSSEADGDNELDETALAISVLAAAAAAAAVTEATQGPRPYAPRGDTRRRTGTWESRVARRPPNVVAFSGGGLAELQALLDSVRTPAILLDLADARAAMLDADAALSAAAAARTGRQPPLAAQPQQRPSPSIPAAASGAGSTGGASGGGCLVLRRDDLVLANGTLQLAGGCRVVVSGRRVALRRVEVVDAEAASWWRQATAMPASCLQPSALITVTAQPPQQAPAPSAAATAPGAVATTTARLSGGVFGYGSGAAGDGPSLELEDCNVTAGGRDRDLLRVDGSGAAGAAAAAAAAASVGAAGGGDGGRSGSPAVTARYCRLRGGANAAVATLRSSLHLDCCELEGYASAGVVAIDAEVRAVGSRLLGAAGSMMGVQAVSGSRFSALGCFLAGHASNLEASAGASAQLQGCVLGRTDCRAGLTIHPAASQFGAGSADLGLGPGLAGAGGGGRNGSGGGGGGSRVTLSDCELSHAVAVGDGGELALERCSFTLAPPLPPPALPLITSSPELAARLAAAAALPGMPGRGGGGGGSAFGGSVAAGASLRVVSCRAGGASGPDSGGGGGGAGADADAVVVLEAAGEAQVHISGSPGLLVRRAKAAA